LETVNGKMSAAIFAAAFLFLAGLAGAADPEAGGEKAQVCVACHGPGGNSSNPAVPSISGQPAQFISTALFMFRSGDRKDPQMSPMAANLSNDDINNLAAYFSAQIPAPPAHDTRPENLRAGSALANKLNCTQCHNRNLRGQQHIPRIAVQQFEYLRAQLRGFRAGTRADFDGNMTSAAQAVGEKDLEVLADYLAGLAPR